MKRIILSLLLTVIAVAGWGQEFTIGKIKYVVTGDNTCSVAEFMPGSNEEINVVVPSSVSNYNIQYTVEGINKLACLQAMKESGYVKSVILPNTLRYIKEGAFAGSLIASIVIPEGVTTLGEYAFAHCRNLISVTLPSTLTTIEQCENASFYGTSSTSLSEGNFNNNSNLPSNVIAEQLGIKFNGEEPVPVPEIHYATIDKITYAFYDNNTCAVIGTESDITGDIVVPSTIQYGNVTYDVKSISEAAFIGTNCTSIVVSEGITTIGMYAFLSCPKLTSVTLPSTLTEIVMSDNRYINPTFAYLQIENFNNKSNIANNEAADKLGISFCERRTNDGLVINGTFIEAYLNYGNNLSLNIPEGITGAQFSVLSSNNIFTSITIPSTFTLGYSSYPRGISYALRSGFKNNTKYPNEEVAAYLGVRLVDEITADGLIIDNHVLIGYAGSNELGLSITIPEGVTMIDPIYTCTNLETIVIPESVTFINPNAFQSCSHLRNVTIKGQDVNIGPNAFANCSAIDNITLYSYTPPYLSINQVFHSSIFDNATLYVPFTSLYSYKTEWHNFKNIVGFETPGVHLISEDKIKYALFDNDNTGWVLGAESDIEGDIVIPSSVIYDHNNYAITTIKEKAFASTNISSAIVSEGITTIETGAFFGCPNLQSITLPATLNNVTFDNNATNGMSPIPSYIHKDNFINHSQINDEVDIWKLGIYLYDEKTAEGFIICNHVLIGYDGPNTPGLSITIPEGVIALSAIFTWSNMETIVIPESVTEISSGAFNSCNSLKNVTIKGQNVSIDAYAFNGCSAIQNFTLYAITPPDVKNIFGYNINYINATLHVPSQSVDAYKADVEWKKFKNIVGFVPEGYYLHHYFNCKDEELTSDEYAYLTKDDSEKRYVNGDGHEYDSNGLCKHCGEPLKCAKPTYDAENGLRCKTEGVQYEIKSGYWIATSPEMPTDISLTIIAKKDGYIDSDPLLLSISKLDLNNDGKFDLNDLEYLQDKVLEKE